MFTKIIANPPYGGHGGLARNIINTLQPLAQETVILAPIRSSVDVIDYIEDIHYLGNLNKYFEASCPAISINRIVSKKVYKYTDLADARKSEKQLQFEKAVRLYNSSHEPFYVTTHGYCTLKRKEALKDVNESLLFVVTTWCASDKVHKGNKAEDVRHNLLGQPINWCNKSSIYTIQFDDPVKLQNFKNWWYRVPGRGVDAQRTLIYFILDLLCEAYNGSPSIKKYVWFLPNVDWSRSWTDQEILAELELPEDFLGEKRMFDLIIANPPFGRSSSLSKKIVKTLLENKVAEEIVVLAPPKTFYGVLDYSKELKCVSSYLNKTVVFKDAAVETLFLDHIVSEKQNKYKEPSDFLLGEKHKVFRNAVIEYNKAHSSDVKLFGGNGVQKYEKSKYLGFEDSLLFEIPIYTPSPLNGVTRQGESYEHNVLRKPIDWGGREKGRGPGLLYFINSSEYNNFSNWWYSAKKRREGGLINFMFDILFILYGGDPSLLKYVEVIPHLDWSRPWTDQEILAEIGLPEDFLSDGANYK